MPRTGIFPGKVSVISGYGFWTLLDGEEELFKALLHEE